MERTEHRPRSSHLRMVVPSCHGAWGIDAAFPSSYALLPMDEIASLTERIRQFRDARKPGNCFSTSSGNLLQIVLDVLPHDPL